MKVIATIEEIEALRASGGLRALGLKTERWEVGDCRCVVHRIYYASEPDQAQTYAVERYCEAHSGMSIEDLHDAHERETRLRANAHRLLVERAPEGSAPVFAWTGQGASRTLRVRTEWMTEEHAAALAALAVDLGEEGAITSLGV